MASAAYREPDLEAADLDREEETALLLPADLEDYAGAQASIYAGFQGRAAALVGPAKPNGIHQEDPQITYIGDIPNDNQQKLLFIGAVGSQKSTLINTLTNKNGSTEAPAEINSNQADLKLKTKQLTGYVTEGANHCLVDTPGLDIADPEHMFKTLYKAIFQCRLKVARLVVVVDHLKFQTQIGLVLEVFQRVIEKSLENAILVITNVRDQNCETLADLRALIDDGSESAKSYLNFLCTFNSESVFVGNLHDHVSRDRLRLAMLGYLRKHPSVNFNAVALPSRGWGIQDFFIKVWEAVKRFFKFKWLGRKPTPSEALKMAIEAAGGVICIIRFTDDSMTVFWGNFPVKTTEDGMIEVDDDILNSAERANVEYTVHYHMCAICHGLLVKDDASHATACHHTFHTTCIQQWYDRGANRNCPTCRTPLAERPAAERPAAERPEAERGLARLIQID